MTKLGQLYAERARKFDEICSFISRKLGYGELAMINEDVRAQVVSRAKQYISHWEDAAAFRLNPALRKMTPLRRLLSEYRTICERILDERDIETGLWAYKRRIRRRPAVF